MREILFRGLHRRKGEKVKLDGTPVESMWVYGGYCQYNEQSGIIYQTEPEFQKYPVYADSAGQYTGGDDINGKKTFEGDIILVEFEDDDYHSVFSKFEVFFDTDRYGWYARWLNNQNEIFCLDEYEGNCRIIGNIHDNPELLKD